MMSNKDLKVIQKQQPMDISNTPATKIAAERNPMAV